MKKNSDSLYAITGFLLASLFIASSYYLLPQLLVIINSSLLHSYYVLPWK